MENASSSSSSSSSQLVSEACSPVNENLVMFHSQFGQIYQMKHAEALARPQHVTCLPWTNRVVIWGAIELANFWVAAAAQRTAILRQVNMFENKLIFTGEIEIEMKRQKEQTREDKFVYMLISRSCLEMFCLQLIGLWFPDPPLLINLIMNKTIHAFLDESPA